MNVKREEQLKEVWIKNVINNLGVTQEYASELYDRLDPYGFKQKKEIREDDSTDTTRDS